MPLAPELVTPARLVVQPATTPLVGSVAVPGDKSVSHRALLFGALARGTTRVRGLLESEDTHATRAAVRALGASVEERGSEILVTGAPWHDVSTPLDCGNSGTTARLLLGALAPRARAMLTGDASLSRRPMGRVTRPLSAMGARFHGAGTLPLTVERAPLRGLDWTAEVASAQVKSAVLLAGLAAEGVTVYREPLATRDHSERMLRAMGAQLDGHAGVLRLVPGPLQAVEVDVPGDASAAAFWWVAAAICPGSDLRLTGVGLNPGRTGALEVLARMGVRVEIEARAGVEPWGDVHLRAEGLRGTTIGGAEVPRLVDELPVLAVAAAFAEGETVIRDASELRVKESDRVTATVSALRTLGFDAEELPDGMVIAGGGPRRAPSGAVASRGDHRIAMAAAIAGLRVGAAIDDPSCIATSYPGFARELARFTEVEDA